MKGILFILGSGSSVDSGLFTYRNNKDTVKIISNTDDIDTIWKSVYEIFHVAREVKELGNTYKIIQDIVNNYPNSTILTQNVDGLVNQINNVNIVELHGNVNYMKCNNCKEIFSTNNNICINCNIICNPTVTLLNEDLDNKVTSKIGKLLKLSYKYVVILGTTLQFQYLRNIINKCKMRGSKVIHINPDNLYDKIEYVKSNPYSTSDIVKYKKECNVRKNEIFINQNASGGLTTFINEYLNIR